MDFLNRRGFEQFYRDTDGNEWGSDIDVIIRELVGPPYYLSIEKILTEMTLPQVLYMLLGKKEHEAADARQFFTLTMAAIGSCFGKNGDQLANKVLDSLDGPLIPVEDIIRDMPRDQAIIMFGAARLAELENGQETNSD